MVAEYTSNPSSYKAPIGIEQSTSCDAHDGDDDELQRFSKWGGAFSADGRGAMGGSLGSTSATKPVAVAVPLAL
jgi:hypothetical protein